MLGNKAETRILKNEDEGNQLNLWKSATGVIAYFYSIWCRLVFFLLLLFLVQWEKISLNDGKFVVRKISLNDSQTI